MVSRIDIGPEGGPFVAINENSNDLELQDINGNVIAKWDETAGQWDLNNNSLTGINAIDASSVETESLVNDRHYAGAYDGADADVRLDNALSAAGDGDVIYLERATYDADRTINHRSALVGTGGMRSRVTGTTLSGDWELTNGARVVNVNFDSGDITFADDGSELQGGRHTLGDVTIEGDECLIRGSRDTNVTFVSDTSGGLVDGVVNGSVTDNGSNSVGDVT